MAGDPNGSSSAAELAARAAEVIYRAVYPVSEAEGPRTDVSPDVVERMMATIHALRDAQRRLDPPIGSTDLDGGLKWLREADDELRSIEGAGLADDVVQARADALALIEHADRAARTHY